MMTWLALYISVAVIFAGFTGGAMAMKYIPEPEDTVEATSWIIVFALWIIALPFLFVNWVFEEIADRML